MKPAMIVAIFSVVLISSVACRQAEPPKDYGPDLDRIERRLDALDTDPVDLSGIENRLDAIEQSLAELSSVQPDPGLDALSDLTGLFGSLAQDAQTPFLPAWQEGTTAEEAAVALTECMTQRLFGVGGVMEAFVEPTELADVFLDGFMEEGMPPGVGSEEESIRLVGVLFGCWTF